MEVHGIVEELLAKRGFSGDALEAFLDPSIKRLADASRLPGLRDAVDLIVPYVRAKRRIVVFGDYDCDGVCASAILALTFRRLGVDVAVFMPDRFTEGYGMTPASVSRMLRENPDVALVITVDCGITSAAEIKFLRDRGIAVIVTDHHMPPTELPVCDAIVDPKVPSQSEGAEALGAKDLCGAGIAFYLANVLATRATEEGLYDGAKFAGPLLVLAGLATVVDIMPLLGQNRVLVANALRAFRSAPVGLTELLLRAQRRPVDLTSRDFGFLIGPRINAAGRMASAREALDLIMESDREQARLFAYAVDRHNVDRKRVENGMVEEVLSLITEESPAAVAVNGEGGAASSWHSGVCGIVASRILERYGVPVAIAVDGHGSVRAPEGYDVHAALTACSHLLERFGGHKAAGGFTVKDGMFEEFSAAFRTVCAKGSRPHGKRVPSGSRRCGFRLAISRWSCMSRSRSWSRSARATRNRFSASGGLCSRTCG